ncbi:hypothetical protein C8J57DRAFT_1514065 [Mycena rebaudengoi]|nr:hypothetical protein C8J57DRAFT_1514065 [Mycena rebaudengoi]
MSTSVQTFRAMHIYKCPPHLSMEAFTIKYEAVMNTVMALPQSCHLSKFEWWAPLVPNRSLDEHLGMPSPEATIFRTIEGFYETLLDEMK